MRKNLIGAACLLMAGAAALTSCNSDEISVKGTNNQEPVQVINLAVANAGDNFGSRAAADRPLYSSAAAQSIENVQVVVYKLSDDPAAEVPTGAALYGNSLQLVAQKKFTDWMNGGVSSVYANHGRQASWSLSGENLIKTPGLYLAYAVGYNTSNYAELTNFDGLTKTSTANFPLSVTAGTGGVKEIFAGATTFKVTNEKQGDGPDAWTFNAKLTLHRQVAGAIGYFTNIPLMGNIDHAGETGATLRLVASAKNTKAVFAGFNSDFETTGTGVKYVVNGYTPVAADAKFYGSGTNDAHTVYEVNLAEWFTGTGMDTNGDGYLNEKDDSWKNKLNEGNANNYSVVRNHLYNIGERDLGDNPGEDPNPGTDPDDKPQDLNNETLVLKVNDNWEAIHQMEID